jgi:hypothetical protein
MSSPTVRQGETGTGCRCRRRVGAHADDKERRRSANGSGRGPDPLEGGSGGGADRPLPNTGGRMDCPDEREGRLFRNAIGCAPSGEWPRASWAVHCPRAVDIQCDASFLPRSSGRPVPASIAAPEDHF